MSSLLQGIGDRLTNFIANMKDTLIVDSIVKQYANTLSVDRVSFTVRPGEILGILGPNGAGKTTAIRMIMGITAPDEGTITFNIDGKTSREVPKKHVGYLPEERGLYRESRVIDILLFLEALKGIKGAQARKRAMEWLERFGLAEHARSKVSQLSKGMAQKVQLIASVLHEPRLIVLDEPFSGLDPVNQDLFKQEILRLAESGCSILLSSHQMNLVEALCERIFLIHKGKRVLYGPLQKIKSEYGAHRVTMRVSRPNWTLPSSPLAESVHREGSLWTVVLQRNVEPLRFIQTLPSDAPIDELSVERISLHDIFVRVAREEAPV